MPVYDYTALDNKGKTISGIIDAEGMAVARQKIRSAGNYPVSIKEVKDTSAKKGKKEPTFSKVFSRISPAEIALMTRQLATLLGAGFPLVSAIDSLMSQTKSTSFEKIIAKLKDGVVEGSSFAATLSQYPNTFSQLYVNMVKAGETSGTLEIVLERLADITEKQQALKRKIQSAMAYPILMTFIGVLVLFFLLTFIVPNITSMFADMDKVLPTPTRILIAISDVFKVYWWVFLILLVISIVAIKTAGNTVKGRYFIDKTKLRLPLFGVLFKKLAISRLARTLGSLLENGVPMMKSLEIVREISGNILITDVIEEAAKSVEKGKGLGVSLAASNIFPSLSVQMIEVGEQSGELESMLIKVADVYENEVESTVMSLTALLEPIMILIMAVVVGFIVLSICLPIFEMRHLAT